jgi:hypothetical protein
MNLAPSFSNSPTERTMMMTIMTMIMMMILPDGRDLQTREFRDIYYSVMAEESIWGEATEL